MATTIPLTFRAAPLPLDFVGTPQDFLDALIARLTAESVNQIAFVATGSVAPTSNVGPWLKDGVTWYVWSDPLATYIPQVISPQSLGYIASQAAPDPTQFTFWIVLNGSGDATGINYFSNGAWKDIYAPQFVNYSTTTQMNTAISNAVGNQSRYPFSAIKSIPQVVTAGDPIATMEFPTEEYDPSNVYDNGTFKFTATVAGIYSFRIGVLIDLTSGSPTDISIGVSLVANGSSVIGFVENESDSDTSGRTMLLSRDVLVPAATTIEAQIQITTTGASTWTIDTNSGANFFQGFLIQTT